MKTIEIAKKILKLPKTTIAFKNATQEELPTHKRVYKLFTKRHRTIVFQNKTVGAALIDLRQFPTFDDYLSSINGKSSGAYYRRRAIKKGYTFAEIDKNDYIDEIYEINTSMEERQGQKMAEKYLVKQESYYNEPGFRYFGVFDETGKLVSYCDVGFFGEFSLVAVLLGHKNHLNNRVMYFMLIEVNRLMFEEYKSKGYNYVMYDMFFGATPGLQQFKRKLGYKPYRVTWKWEN